MSNTENKRGRKRTKRFHNVLLASALVGLITGIGVVVISTSIEWIFRHLEDAHGSIYVALLPIVGLALAALILHYGGEGATPDTSDAYIQRFHDDNYQFKDRRAISRVLAAIATLSLGGALGMEGPSIFFGAVTGDRIQSKLKRFFGDANRRTLLVAGAAAGVSAIFKAPATGAVFALEVPFQDDFARDMLLPTLIASATSYLAFVAFKGVTPLFRVQGAAPFSLRDIGGALLLGLVAGIGARLFAWMLRTAKKVSRSFPVALRVVVFGFLLFDVALVGHHITGHMFVIGPPYQIFTWLLDPRRTLGVLAALLMLRALASSFTIAGGGVGGVFIPLVVCGALLGRMTGHVLSSVNPNLFTVVGISAFLGAGYRVPLAAVMFVAETTGRPGFVVPALLAAVIADVIMGERSVTAYQLPAN